MRLLKTKGTYWFSAAFHSTSALKQPVTGFHRVQTCASTTRVAFSKCYGNPPFKNMQLTLANMAGIMATCGYNWASRAPVGMGPNLLAVNTRNHTGPTRHTTHTWLRWLWKCSFFSLQSAKKGAFYLINENGQALKGLKWATLKVPVFRHMTIQSASHGQHTLWNTNYVTILRNFWYASSLP